MPHNPTFTAHPNSQMKIMLWILLFTTAALPSREQTPWPRYRDSLLHVLSHEKEDSFKAGTLRDLAVAYLDRGQSDSAAFYAKNFGSLSEKQHYLIGMAISLSIQAAVLSDQNKPNEAIVLDLQAIEVAKSLPNKKILANNYNNTAIVYFGKGDYPKSLELYLKALDVYEALHDTASMAFANSNIAEVYVGLKEYLSAYAYSLRGISLCRARHQTKGLGPGLLNLGSALINLKRYDTALVVLQDDWELALKINDRPEQINILADMDYAYVGLGQFDRIKPTADQLMAVALSLDSKEGEVYALLGLKYYYLDKKEYGKAEQASLEAFDIAKRNGLTVDLREACKEAASVEMARGDQLRYKYYNDLMDSIDDALLSDKILKNTQDIEGKYSLNKKQVEIDGLNEQKRIQQLTLRQRMMTIWGLGVLVLVIGFTGMLYYRNYQNKKSLLIADNLLREQRIAELEKEKQLLAAQAVLQGQVEERTRLAKDLHDGLGSILSSAKYSFINIKDNLVISGENAAAFEKSMAILDTSISELRRVAHNMMPEALIKFGLDTALRDFCNSVDQSGALHLTYQSYDLDEATIPAITSAAIYRIIQELVNNSIRHSAASDALVQLVRKDGTLSITVEDNGRGFDSRILAKNAGMGYLNLENRVAYLNGAIDIRTSPGNGTSVHIEIKNIIS
ncbi:MAG TPA: tetratricopeptide repeat protein [Puia sp.]|nr:tetratricopeptide repeat protein [Puia sp.]